MELSYSVHTHSLSFSCFEYWIFNWFFVFTLFWTFKIPLIIRRLCFAPCQLACKSQRHSTTKSALNCGVKNDENVGICIQLDTLPFNCVSTFDTCASMLMFNMSRWKNSTASFTYFNGFIVSFLWLNFLNIWNIDWK